MTTPHAPTPVVVLTTLATEDDAVALVRALLDCQLVACGTILPGARSSYRWEGTVEDAREVVVLLKTVAERIEGLRAAFVALHPYEVPELVVLSATSVGAPYLAWLATNVAKESEL